MEDTLRYGGECRASDLRPGLARELRKLAVTLEHEIAALTTDE